MAGMRVVVMAVLWVGLWAEYLAGKKVATKVAQKVGHWVALMVAWWVVLLVDLWAESTAAVMVAM